MDGVQRGGRFSPPSAVRYKIRLDDSGLSGFIVLHHGLPVSLLSRLPFDRKTRFAGVLWRVLRVGRSHRSEIDGTVRAGVLCRNFLPQRRTTWAWTILKCWRKYFSLAACCSIFRERLRWDTSH